MEDMRSVLTMQPSQMDEWRSICVAFAEKENAKLVFVNETGCGLEYADGSLWHPSVEDMMSKLKGDSNEVIY